MQLSASGDPATRAYPNLGDMALDACS